MTLTPKQQRFLSYIQEYRDEKGYPPTQWEMARRFKLKSLGTVQNYLKSLESKGYVSKAWNGKRAIRVHTKAVPLSSPKQISAATAVTIPLAGIVAAGRPIEAIEQQETLEVPASLLRGGENFALRVRGESMMEDGIRDGDLVVVRKQATAESGQTVVAMIDGEATVKRFFKRKDSVELHPANAAMQPLVVTVGRGFQILGVVVGLIRSYS